MLNRLPTARTDLIFRPLAQEWVVLDALGRRLHVMNLSAALVWGHIDGRTTEEELVDLVWAAFDRIPDRDRLASEVGSVLRDFDRRGLLEPGDTVQ